MDARREHLGALVFAGIGVWMIAAPIAEGLLALALAHHGRTVDARVVAHHAVTAKSRQVSVRTQVAMPWAGLEVEAWIREPVATPVGGVVRVTHAPGVPWYAVPAAEPVEPFEGAVGRAVSIGLGLLLLAAAWQERRRARRGGAR